MDPDNMRDVLDGVMEDILEDPENQMIFDIFYPAIYFDHFHFTKERMLGRWRTTFHYSQDMLSFYNHYYLMNYLKDKFQPLFGSHLIFRVIDIQFHPSILDWFESVHKLPLQKDHLKLAT